MATRQENRNVDLSLKYPKKRQILLNNNHENLIKRSYVPSTTQTFWQQSDALEYIAEREKENTSNEILYLFSFESQPRGKRRYQVSDIDVFIQEYYQLPPNQRHTYEIIVDKKPSKLYFDLEYEKTWNPTLDGPKLTSNFIQFVLNFMRKRSDDLDYSFKDVLVLDSTSEKKFSRHLIFQTKDPFLDNIAVGKFVNLILEDIHGCLINHQCSAVSNQSQSYASSSGVFAKSLIASLESRLHLFENCECVDDYTGLKFRDMTEFIVKKVEKDKPIMYVWFCDIGVYTKNRAFRLLRSSKFEKPNYIFTVAPENQWTPIVRGKDPNEAERQTFMASLVYFHKPIRRFIHVDEENCAPVQTAISRTQRSTQSTHITDDIRKMSLDYPELVQFMNNLARDDQTSRLSRLYKAKEVQNDFRWEISFLYVGEYKYCERIKRHHTNNNIFFVVDMRKGTYRQKCHDPDCKNFQGIERTLPRNVTPWLTMLEEDWQDDQSQ